MMKIALTLGFLLVACSPNQTVSDAGVSVSGDSLDASTAVIDGGQVAADAGSVQSGLTWHKEIRAVVESHCSGCHQDGEIAPFVLDDYDSVFSIRAAVAEAVRSGAMPPWQAAKGCNEYEGDFSLSESQRQDILDWVETGAAEGDASDYIAPEVSNTQMSRTDITLTMPVDYLPASSPDDYRCFIIDWPEERQRYITGFAVDPGNARMVHHVIGFLIEPRLVDRFRAKDDRDEGPGYTCFGGPGEIMDGVAWIGSWAPGGRGYDLPEGTGIPVPPGSVVVMQVHYNTLVETPQSDRSSMRFKLDDTVAKPSKWLPWTHPLWVDNRMPMSIPAGQAGVRHAFSFDPTIDRVGMPFGAGRPFDIHLVGTHMHLLGKSIRLSIQRQGGGETCLEEVQKWDFNWQEGVKLAQPVRFEPGDQLSLECVWDNTPENQPVVDGQRLPPRDVIWGEGTRDEMCLGLLYVSPAD
jgi:mono/diheme cytochrome c family protein